MRDPKRIDTFTSALNYIWKEKVPDWRFGQLIANVFGDDISWIWIFEEDKILEIICSFFDMDIEEVKKEVSEMEIIFEPPPEVLLPDPVDDYYYKNR